MSEEEATYSDDMVPNVEPAPPTPPVITRTCKTCGHTGPLEDFPRNSVCKYGREPHCRACAAERRKKVAAAGPAKKRATEKMPERCKNRDAGPATPNVAFATPNVAPATPNTPPTALSVQIGGDHYKQFAIQPIEFTTRNKLNFIQGCIVKRICRYNLPGGKGVQDLLKIKHEIDCLIQIEGLQETSI